MLQIYNTITQKKSPFKPITAGLVKMYTCGITVYDHCHIGHARTFVAFDVIVRYLRFSGYKVKYIRNITDIDDKIIARALQNNEPVAELTARFIQAMHNDAAALNLLTPDEEPRATQFMAAMIAFVEKLEQQGYAYQAENGDVYYQVRKFKRYGCLSKRNIDDMQSGARVEINIAKRDPLDFVLWKQAKPGEPSWESPWGNGRPGWHLECSVMAMHYLGETFDIHGGGFDLIFPHHENELAQSEAVTGKTFANYWLHVGFLNINKEKMSKSLGNFATVEEILQEVHPEVLRYFMISGHYRSPLEYSPQQITLSHKALERFYIALRGLPVAAKIQDSTYEKRFIAAMNDDFNTPEALSVLFDLAREVNRLRQGTAAELEQAAALAGLLKYLGGVLGLLQSEPEEFLQDLTGSADVDTMTIEKLIALRNIARENKEWQEADRFREELTVLGVSLEDTSEGTIWRRG